MTLLPKVTTPLASLVRDASYTTGDLVLVVGGVANTVGDLLPGDRLGGSVVLIGTAVDQTGTEIRRLGDTLHATMLRVQALSINPLLGTDGLLTPVLENVGTILRPTVGNSGLLGPITGPVFITVHQALNGTGGATNINLLTGLLNPVLTPLIAGPPSTGLLGGLLGNGSVIGGTSGGGLLNGVLNLNGILAPVTGIVGGNGAGGLLNGILGPVTGGSGGTGGGLLNGVLAPVTGGGTSGSGGLLNGVLAPVTGGGTSGSGGLLPGLLGR